MSEEQKRRVPNLVVALAAALVVALGVIVWLVLDQRGTADDLDAARARANELTTNDESDKEALEAAKVVLGEITTYSFKDGEHDFAWLDKIADQELKDKLAPNVGALQQAIVDGKVSAKGQVLDAAARVVAPDQVEVLAFVDQAITDETNKDIKIEEQRVSMTMTRSAGQWQISRLDLLSGTNAQGLPGAGTEGTAP